MLDYGKVQVYLHQQGKVLEVKPPPPPRVPDAWDPKGTGEEWDAAMLKLGFDGTVTDEPRWIYSHAPTGSRLGVTIIVYFDDDGRWKYDFTLDTESTENSSDWDVGIEAMDESTTPLAVAREATEHVQELLTMALRTLLAGK